MSNFLEKLNPEQKNAVTTTEGYIRVIAGAGSGKTKTLTHRMAYIIHEMGCPANRIMALTFTNKATNVMEARIKNLIGDTLPYINTFHAFGNTMLREDIHYLHLSLNFNTIDVANQNQIMREIYKNQSLRTQDLSYKDALGAIEKLKQDINYVTYITSPDYTQLQKACDHAYDIEHKVFYAYLQYQRKSSSLDYHDLICFPLYIFKTEPTILQKWQKRFDYILVDEYQDVNRQQNELIDLLSGNTKNLFVVGDPDQTIYSWRGSQADLILKYATTYPDVKTIVLNQNYRSYPGILSVSNSLIRHNRNRIDKDLVAVKTGTAIVHHYHAINVKKEAEWIADRVKLLLASGKKADNIAILYRSHHVSRNIEEAFINKKIPYMLYRGVAFYGRQEIKDIIGYLRLINYGDDLSFARVINTPRRGLGDKKMELLNDYANDKSLTLFQALEELKNTKEFEKTKAKEFITTITTLRKDISNYSLSDYISHVLQVTEYEKMCMLENDQERLDNIKELISSIMAYEKLENGDESCTLADYLTKIALFTDSDTNNKFGVHMMTIHSAKGLEFPIVFLCGLNEGIFPSAKAKTQETLEEERRIAYVAITRAEEQLYLTDAEGINYDNSIRTPSRFLYNIDPHLYTREGIDEEAFLKAYTEANMEHPTSIYKNNEVLALGTRVTHLTLGPGLIKNVNDYDKTYTIFFDKTQSERIINFHFAGLCPND